MSEMVVGMSLGVILVDPQTQHEEAWDRWDR
jgi:hypothetical protein